MAFSTVRATGGALTVALLTAASAAFAQGPALRSVPGAPRSGAYIAYGPVCDRAAVRSCQAEAQFRMKLCERFPGRFACADRILAEQSACFVTTGCY